MSVWASEFFFLFFWFVFSSVVLAISISGRNMFNLSPERIRSSNALPQRKWRRQIFAKFSISFQKLKTIYIFFYFFIRCYCIHIDWSISICIAAYRNRREHSIQLLQIFCGGTSISFRELFRRLWHINCHSYLALSPFQQFLGTNKIACIRADAQSNTFRFHWQSACGSSCASNVK